jgi:hypothetical protein
MIANDITLDTDKTYSRTLSSGQRGRWDNPTDSIGDVDGITVSHETTKTGIVSTVVYLDMGLTPATGYEDQPKSGRVQFKFVYPESGYTDTNTILAAAKTRLIDMVNDNTIWQKLLNKEA